MTISCSSNTEIWYVNIQKGNTDCACDAVILGFESHRSWFISVNDACFQQCVKPVLNLLCIMLLWKLQSPTVCVSVALSIKWPGFFLHLWMPFFLWPHSWLDMLPKNHLPCYHLSRRCLRFIITRLSMVFSGVHNKVHCPFCVLLKLAYSGTPILQTTLFNFRHSSSFCLWNEECLLAVVSLPCCFCKITISIPAEVLPNDAGNQVSCIWYF